MLLDCGHKVCTDCFKKPWTPLSQRGPIPEDFGCTDVEVLLDRDDDELIQQKVAEWAAREPEQAAAYNQAWSEWMEKEGRAREAKRLALARCPLCRKPTTWATQEERDEQNFKTAIVIADDTDEDLGDAAGGKEEAKEEAAAAHAAATAAEEEKHVEAKDEEVREQLAARERYQRRMRTAWPRLTFWMWTAA